MNITQPSSCPPFWWSPCSPTRGGCPDFTASLVLQGLHQLFPRLSTPLKRVQEKRNDAPTWETNPPSHKSNASLVCSKYKPQGERYLCWTWVSRRVRQPRSNRIKDQVCMVAAVLRPSACCCLKEPRISSSFLYRLLISIILSTLLLIHDLLSNIYREITSKSAAVVAVIAKLTLTWWTEAAGDANDFESIRIQQRNNGG